MSPANLCRHCGMREDWHDAIDGACPDGDGPHYYSEQYGAPVVDEWTGRAPGFVIGASLEPVAVLAAERYSS